jgi:hypothetical protein
MSDETQDPEEPMSQEPSAASVLQQQNTTLQAQLAELREQHNAAISKLEEIEPEWQAGKTSAIEIAELKAALRDRLHFDKFAELASASKAKAKALRQLWREAKASGYEPDSDEINEKALQTVVAHLKTASDFAFDPDEAAAATDTTAARKPTSRTKYGLDVNGPITPGGGRSPERNQGADGTIVTQEMRADPKFMLDPKNKELIRDAALGGRFR